MNLKSGMRSIDRVPFMQIRLLFILRRNKIDYFYGNNLKQLKGFRTACFITRHFETIKIGINGSLLFHVLIFPSFLKLKIAANELILLFPNNPQKKIQTPVKKKENSESVWIRKTL